MPLREKTIAGMAWSFVDNFSYMSLNFVTGIILARLLSPMEYGLTGMIVIFIAISETFIDSGFSQALIRKSDCTQRDFSTVYYYNLAVGILCYAILFFSAGLISDFLNEKRLVLLIRVLAINLVINSTGVIQRTILIKNINFKMQAQISVIATIVSGAIGIAMAVGHCGVWSLVGQMISRSLCTVVLLRRGNKWKSIRVFDWRSFREMFGFGSKLLLAELLNTTYRNVYYLIIGKYYSAENLGFYTRAEQFKNLPTQNLTGVIQRVSYPVLATMRDEPEQLKSGYKKLICSTMLPSFVISIWMAAVAPTLIRALIGEKWLLSAEYLRLLCFSGMFYPLNVLNLNLLKVLGRSDIHLHLEVIKKVLLAPIIVIGVFYGIRNMLWGMIVMALIGYFLNSYYTGKFIKYKTLEQIRDVLPSFLVAAATGLIVFMASRFVMLSPIPLLSLQVLMGVLICVLLCETTRLSDYLYLKGIVVETFHRWDRAER
jgi:O-antigen/teichoic acid export membrane protein